MVEAMGSCDGLVQVRPASAADARGIAEVRVRTWQVAYRDILPAEFLDDLSVDASEDRFRERLSAPTPDRSTWVAEAAGQVIGFVAAGVPRDEGTHPLTGEVYAIYVMPDCWDNGIGWDLLTRAEGELRERGYAEAVLWVLADNQRARAFYERAGWRSDGGTKQDTFGGAEVTEVRYRIDLKRSRLAESG
jgi:ribosomal protein S18 acetylase RimI-like enzyme